MRPLAVIAGLVAALVVAPAAAQAYKWKDAAGKIHFSDTPPPDRAAERIAIRPQTAEDPAAARRDWRAQLEESGVRRQQQQTANLAEQRKERLAESRCRSARAYLDMLERPVRVFRTGSDGQREYLDDKDRPAAIVRARESVDAECR